MKHVMKICQSPVLLLAFLVFPAWLQAQTVLLEPVQPFVDIKAGPLAIGGSSEQMLAQTVKSEVHGVIQGVFLPVACDTGSLVVQVRDVVDGVPGKKVLAEGTVRSTYLPASPQYFRYIPLQGNPLIDVGTAYALVLFSNGSCGLMRAVGNDSYDGGEAFFDARPNPPGWIPSFGPDLDLPFMVSVRQVP